MSQVSSTAIAFRSIYGINGALVDNLAFLEDDTVAYVAGHNIVLYNKNDRTQKSLPNSEKSDGTTCFASGGRRFVAVAERLDRAAHVSIYDMRTLRKRKTLVSEGCREMICMQFSEDNQHLLTLSGAPDYTLSAWNWAKAKLNSQSVVGSQHVPITRCSFNPTDASLTCVTGKDVIRFYRVAERELRLLQEYKFDNHNFKMHMWLRRPEDHLVAGTENGDVLLFRSTEYICHLSCSPGPSMPISSILTLDRGFLLGSKAGSFAYISFVGDENSRPTPESFVCENKWSTELCTGSVLSMALSPTEDTICAVTTDNQLLYMPAENLTSIQSDHVKYLVCSFHGPKPIVGLDTCYRKPLFATCSRDNAVKIWNFQRMELELNKTFPEETNCVALHPAGLHIAIGFSDKLRIYHILVDDLKLCQEIAIKNCRECKFSDGGNFLGVANGNTINIFSFFSGEKVIDLRGHNSKIRSLQWIENGNQLLSCGQDGAVYLWDVEEGKRVGELVRKGILYTSAVSTGDTAFVVGSDRILREMDMPELNVAKEYEAGTLLGHLAITGTRNALFASTADPGKLGIIRLYPYPVTGEYTEVPCMSSPITRMMLTRDQNYLIVTDEMGCVGVFDLFDRFKNNASAAAATGAALEAAQGDWTDEVLVSRVDLEDKSQLVMELRAKVDELKLHNEYKLKLKEMSYSEKIKEVTDKFVHELEQAKHKLSLLQEERTDAEIEHSKRIKQLEEKHQHDLQETETEFQTQIMEEVGKYQKLVRLRDAQAERLAEQRRVLVRTQEQYIQELKSDFETKLSEERQLRAQLEEELAELEKSLQETQTQLEDDVDTEVEGLRKNFEERLAAAKEVTLKYKGDNGIMKKKFSVIQKDMEDQKEEIKTLLEKEQALHEQIKVLEKEVSAHKREIKARDGTIGEKEKRIYELKKKNQELDKFKFVLDFKIRELKRQIEPRQQEIQAMKEQIKDMDMELEKYHKLNTTLDQNIGDMRALIDATQHEISTKWSRAKQLEHLIARFKSQIQLSVSLIQNPPELRSKIEQIYSEHVSDALEIKAAIEPEVEQEYERHRQYLSKSVHALKRQLTESASGHGRANRGLMDENMNLIAVITQQREYNRELKLKYQAALGRLQHLARVSARRVAKEGGTSYDPSMSGADDEVENDPLLQLEQNRERMARLRARVRELEARMMMQKAYSREVLPPMDGVHQQLQQMQLQQEDSIVESDPLGHMGDSFVSNS